ncbi:DNA-binding protein [Alicycliphilus denitrificans]|uniref:DNA-binding protein n=1 Tax=Alicycliphilus denitrificans TaxID=179636 RepID=UPI00384FE7F4
MDTLPATEARMQAEIEALRAQHPDTQDLYREVCVLLFFRYGLTPTANKLYQLVRKGSMSAPAEALAKFWETLREKSRLRIEHPDLPQSLRDAAGEMVGQLWQRAQAEAQDTLAQLREEARAAVVAADGLAQSASARADAADASLGMVRDALRANQERVTSLQSELGRAQGEVAALQRQLDAGAGQRQELQAALSAAQERFTGELEQQRAAAAAADERHGAEVRRALLDVDRERGNAAKLQKEVEQARRDLASQAQAHREATLQRQQQIEALHQRSGELEGRAAQLLEQRDQLSQELQATRLRLEAVGGKRVSGVRAAKGGATKPSRAP